MEYDCYSPRYASPFTRLITAFVGFLGIAGFAALLVLFMTYGAEILVSL